MYLQVKNLRLVFRSQVDAKTVATGGIRCGIGVPYWNLQVITPAHNRLRYIDCAFLLCGACVRQFDPFGRGGGWG